MNFSRSVLVLVLAVAIAAAGYFYYQSRQNTIEITLPNVKVDGR